MPIKCHMGLSHLFHYMPTNTIWIEISYSRPCSIYYFQHKTRSAFGRSSQTILTFKLSDSFKIQLLVTNIPRLTCWLIGHCTTTFWYIPGCIEISFHNLQLNRRNTYVTLHISQNPKHMFGSIPYLSNLKLRKKTRGLKCKFYPYFSSVNCFISLSQIRYLIKGVGWENLDYLLHLSVLGKQKRGLQMCTSILLYTST